LQTWGDGGGGTQVAEYFRPLYIFHRLIFFLPAEITSSAANFHLAAVLLLGENMLLLIQWLRWSGVSVWIKYSFFVLRSTRN
jgi:hypothetical protein